MRRRLFTFASDLSLLLCVASVVLWVRSYRLQEHAQWVAVRADNSYVSWDRRRITVSWAAGTVVFDAARQSLSGAGNEAEIKLFAVEKEPPFEFVSKPISRRPMIGLEGVTLWHGLYLGWRPHYAYGQRLTIAGPLWALALLAAILPSARLLGTGARQRRLQPTD